MRNHHHHHQQGMTLIEIMISLLIGAFLIGGVLKLFVNAKQTYRMQSGLSRMQENGRFAMEFLAKDMRMAGFFGCLSRNFDMANVENELDDQGNVAWDISAPVTGFDNVSNSFSVFSSVVPNTDVIIIRGLADSISDLQSPYSDSAQMFVDTSFNSDCPAGSANTCHIGEILMVTDCTQATLFQTTNTTAIAGGSGINVVHSGNNTFTPGNTSPVTFTRSYAEGAQIARLQTYAYFIRLNNASQPSLFRSRISLTGNSTNGFLAEELIEGVENMQILYGEDTDGNGTANYYVPAGTAGLNMGQVISVRISLLVRSIANNLTSAPRAYSYNGTTTTPPTGDRYLRRTFSSTIAIRNRLP